MVLLKTASSSLNSLLMCWISASASFSNLFSSTSFMKSRFGNKIVSFQVFQVFSAFLVCSGLSDFFLIFFYFFHVFQGFFRYFFRFCLSDYNFSQTNSNRDGARSAGVPSHLFVGGFAASGVMHVKQFNFHFVFDIELEKRSEGPDRHVGLVKSD